MQGSTREKAPTGGARSDILERAFLSHTLVIKLSADASMLLFSKYYGYCYEE
jgi:hypothetical protein